jgi:hypothetical protein
MSAAVSTPGPYAAVNGVRVASGSLTIPYYGAWTADFTLATPEPVSGAASVALGQLSLRGTVYRSAPYTGSRTARLVAGAAGWRNTLSARSYEFAGGVPLSMVLQDAATELGERVSLATDSTLGQAWTRPTQSGAQLLYQIAGPLWWIDNAGVTRLSAARATSIINSTFTVVSADPGRGMYEIATESMQDWMPGATFSAPTLDGIITISSVTFHVDNDGILRVRVLSAGAADQ